MRLPVILAALVAASPGAAAPLDPFTGLVTLGDSLSDVGNTAALIETVAALPLPPGRDVTPVALGPYANGRFANGPIWYDRIATTFRATGRPTVNLAFGGAEAEAENPFAVDPTDIPGTLARLATTGDLSGFDFVPDIGAQIDIYDATVPQGALGENPLGVIWAGANDYLDDEANPTVTDEAREAAIAIGEAALDLAARGIETTALFKYGDLALIPALNLPGIPQAVRDNATLFTDTFNSQLDAEIAALRAAGLDPIEVDLGPLLPLLVSDPESFGVSNATLPCLLPTPAGIVECEDPSDFAFYDVVHFNSTIHGEIADKFEEAVGTATAPAPVPLPAGFPALAAGLGLLAGSRTLRGGRSNALWCRELVRDAPTDRA